MTSTKDLIKATISGERSLLWVTDGHYEWMNRPESQQVHTPAALQHAQNVLTGVYHRHPGLPRLSASGIGKDCGRAKLFAYYGVPGLPEDVATLDNFNIGNAVHLWWQMEGLSQGYLDECERWVFNEKLRLGGRMDGEKDGKIVDFKTAGGHQYDRIVSKDREPAWENRLQLAGYRRLTGFTRGSIVYIDKETGAFHEFPEFPDETVDDALDRILFGEEVERPDGTGRVKLRGLHDWIDLDAFPQMLVECQARTGYTFNRCPWREHCPSVPAHPDAPEVGKRHRPPAEHNAGVKFTLPTGFATGRRPA